MQERFNVCIQQLPNQLAAALAPLLNDSFSGHISRSCLMSLITASGLNQQQVLFSLLPVAASMSSAPISDFYVGAIAVGASGDLYLGANLELPAAALNHSVHAEQSAICHAWLNGESHITDIIVNASPCGHCRQFINELVGSKSIQISIPGYSSAPLSEFLPNAFGPIDLGIENGLMSPQDIGLKLNTDDPLLAKAVKHANQSYAPYTHTHASVALHTKTNHILVGQYAENAAFNPAMMPMQMALSGLMRHGLTYDAISRAVLVESARGKISLVNASANALNAISSLTLEHVII